MAHPFLKWAGGKRQLLPIIKKYYPFEDGYNKYIEPFVGGGAVLFDVLDTYNIKEVYISDVNDNLINTYIVIQKHIDLLIAELKKISTDYAKIDSVNKKQYFLNRRSDYNNISDVLSQSKDTQIRKAALLIFLNRTCFNGLYRVNSKGEYNVSFGNYKTFEFDEENLRNVSKKLQKVKIICCPYKDMLTYIDDKTFVFMDPPYRPLTQSASFNAYNKDVFKDQEQKELAEFAKTIDKLGAKFIVCNSDPHNVDPTDDFFDELYKDFDVYRVSANRMINSKGSSRGSINEILITNYKPWGLTHGFCVFYNRFKILTL